MIESIFGNETIEKILLHLFHYGTIHASAIARDYDMSLTPVLRQLDRLERAGVVVSRQMGRSRLYSFNPKSPFTKPVKEIVQIAYDAISLTDRQRLFSTRRRPRRKGKPVYESA